MALLAPRLMHAEASPPEAFRGKCTPSCARMGLRAGQATPCSKARDSPW